MSRIFSGACPSLYSEMCSSVNMLAPPLPRSDNMACVPAPTLAMILSREGRKRASLMAIGIFNDAMELSFDRTVRLPAASAGAFVMSRETLAIIFLREGSFVTITTSMEISPIEFTQLRSPSPPSGSPSSVSSVSTVYGSCTALVHVQKAIDKQDCEC